MAACWLFKAGTNTLWLGQKGHWNIATVHRAKFPLQKERFKRTSYNNRTKPPSATNWTKPPKKTLCSWKKSPSCQFHNLAGSSGTPIPSFPPCFENIISLPLSDLVRSSSKNSSRAFGTQQSANGTWYIPQINEDRPTLVPKAAHKYSLVTSCPDKRIIFVTRIWNFLAHGTLISHKASQKRGYCAPRSSGDCCTDLLTSFLRLLFATQAHRTTIFNLSGENSCTLKQDCPFGVHPEAPKYHAPTTQLITAPPNLS